MIIALGDIYARIPSREQVRELMRATQVRAREEPGCSLYLFAETLDDPGHFVVMQRWHDREALEAHYRSHVFADYQDRIGEHLVRSSELRVHEADAGAMPSNVGPIEVAQED